MSRHSASDISRPPSGASTVRNPDRPHSQVSLALGPRPRSLSRTGNVTSNKTGLQNRSSVVSVLWDSRCAPVDLCHPHLMEMRLRVLYAVLCISAYWGFQIVCNLDCFHACENDLPTEACLFVQS